MIIRRLSLGLAALLLAACNPNEMRDVRTANRLLFDRQDPRFCGLNCPSPVPGEYQQKVAGCAIERVKAVWDAHIPDAPTTNLSFADTMTALDRRIAARNGSQRAPAEDPADEDAAAARMAALFDAAVPGCVEKARAGG